MGLQLLDCPLELILQILSRCDIASVLALGETCRYLHDIGSDASVWLALAQNLQHRNIIESGGEGDGDLRALSGAELKQRIQRLVLGPESWSPPSAQPRVAGESADTFQPRIGRRIVLHPSVRNGPGILTRENAAVLTPSGRFALFRNWYRLECWEVSTDRLVWLYDAEHGPLGEIESGKVLQFAVDELGGADAGTLRILQCVQTFAAQRENHLEVLEIDTQSWTHTILFSWRVPDTADDNPFHRPFFVGDIAVVGSSTVFGDAIVLICDCKSGSRSSYILPEVGVRSSYILLEGTHPLWSVIPKFLVFKVYQALPRNGGDKSESEALYVYETSHLLNGNGIQDLTLMSPVAYHVIPQLVSTSIDQLSVHPDPLRAVRFRVWVHASGQSESAPSYLHRYTLDLSAAGGHSVALHHVLGTLLHLRRIWRPQTQGVGPWN
ncbi:unnamed protein product [Mycena citricolor]|uniref:F-box domain-containing protein n=1 Tax=Mycena citricolor TaxID=2018698 RepID=A0AAD2HYQ1_9AGAR|nr:unnamed protein product [Mycena citricolor]